MAVRRKTTKRVSTRRSTARRTTARKVAKRTSARRSSVRRTTARKVARRTTTRKVARRTTTRKVARRTTKRDTSSFQPAKNISTRSAKDHDLAAMYLSILIVGVAGIILLFARPTPMMQKVIGILLVVLGLWGLLMKK